MSDPEREVLRESTFVIDGQTYEIKDYRNSKNGMDRVISLIHPRMSILAQSMVHPLVSILSEASKLEAHEQTDPQT